MIRKAQPTDAGALAALLRAIGQFPFHNAATAEESAAHVRRQLDAALASPSHSIYLAEEAGDLLGYAAVHWLPYVMLAGPEGFVSELFIGEAARGQGLGGALLAAVREEAVARGCSRLSLLNMRDRESYRRGFYRQQGWEERADAANFILRL